MSQGRWIEIHLLCLGIAMWHLERGMCVDLNSTMVPTSPAELFLYPLSV